MSDNGDDFVYCLKILSIHVSGFTPRIKVIYSTNVLIHTQKFLSVTTMTNSKNSMRKEFLNVIWFASCRFKYVKIKTQWFYLKSEKEHPRSKVCPLMSLGSCCFERGQPGQSLSLSLLLPWVRPILPLDHLRHRQLVPLGRPAFAIIVDICVEIICTHNLGYLNAIKDK